ncbi:MAG: sorbosone dehydrogenase family protein [Akkermansiaceae bacterium]
MIDWKKILAQVLIYSSLVTSSFAAANFELVELAQVPEPLSVDQAPGDSLRLFVLSRNGPIYVLKRATTDDTYELLEEPFVDLSKLPNGLHKGIESGALDFVFRPDFATSGVFFARYYKDKEYQDPEVGWRRLRDEVLIRGTVSEANANRADVSSIREIFTVPKANTTHCGGWMDFNSVEVAKNGTCYLYLAYGNDERLGEEQNGDNFYGKMVRIDVGPKYDAVLRGEAHYGVPADNPFVGDDKIRDEIVHLGLRNPWRCSFDRETGDLWIGDVGGAVKEEVNRVSYGKLGYNFQWPILEGTEKGEKPETPRGPGVWTAPVYQYLNQAGNSVIGGYVYRGNQVPSLKGKYLFTNHWGFSNGRFRLLGSANNKELDTFKFPYGTCHEVSSFSEGNDGEIYVCEYKFAETGGKTGRVFRIGPRQ